MKLKEVCELLDQDGEGRCDSSRLAAFLQAVGVRKPPPSYEIARRKHAEREAAAAAAAAERRREEADFAARMRAAEESGCVASFALMDRYFSRYQLKAEDIWTHGRSQLLLVAVGHLDAYRDRGTRRVRRDVHVAE